MNDRQQGCFGLLKTGVIHDFVVVCYQVILDIALRWSAEIGRITILLTLHSAGVQEVGNPSSITFSIASDRAKNGCYLLKELFRQG